MGEKRIAECRPICHCAALEAYKPLMPQSTRLCYGISGRSKTKSPAEPTTSLSSIVLNTQVLHITVQLVVQLRDTNIVPNGSVYSVYVCEAMCRGMCKERMW